MGETVPREIKERTRGQFWLVMRVSCCRRLQVVECLLYIAISCTTIVSYSRSQRSQPYKSWKAQGPLEYALIVTHMDH